jgi:hypothetical protein
MKFKAVWVRCQYGSPKWWEAKVSLCHWCYTITDARIRLNQAFYIEMNVRLTLLLLYPRRRISKNLLNKRLNKTRCQSGRTGEDKYPLPSLWFNSCSYTSLLSYLLTPGNRVFLNKLTGFQLVMKFTAFYGTRKLITAVTSTRHPSLSWASSIQSIPPCRTSWRSILTHNSQGFIDFAMAIHHITM